jgi:transcriptional regulator with XRE-family HTH domain
MGATAKWIDCHVGGRIRLRRTLVGMTQEDLARALGISYQQLQKYETAGNRVSAGRLYEIAEALGVEMSYFFEDIGGEPSEVRTVPQAHGGTQRSTIDIVQNFSKIENPALRASISGLVKSVARWRRAQAANQT